MGYGSMPLSDEMVRTVVNDACVEGGDGEEGGVGTAPVETRDSAVLGTASNAKCAYGGGRLGELLAASRCRLRDADTVRLTLTLTLTLTQATSGVALPSTRSRHG